MASSASKGPRRRRRWLAILGVVAVLLITGFWVQHRTALPQGQWRVVGVRNAKGSTDVSGVGATLTVTRTGLMLFDGINHCSTSSARVGPRLFDRAGGCTAVGWAGAADAPTPRTAEALNATCLSGPTRVRRVGDTVQLQRDGVVVTLAR